MNTESEKKLFIAGAFAAFAGAGGLTTGLAFMFILTVAPSLSTVIGMILASVLGFSAVIGLLVLGGMAIMAACSDDFPGSASSQEKTHLLSPGSSSLGGGMPATGLGASAPTSRSVAPAAVATGTAATISDDPSDDPSGHHCHHGGHNHSGGHDHPAGGDDPYFYGHDAGFNFS